MLFSSLEHRNPCLNQKKKFQFLFPNHIKIFKKMTEDGLTWQYQL